MTHFSPHLLPSRQQLYIHALIYDCAINKAHLYSLDSADPLANTPSPGGDDGTDPGPECK